MSFFIPSYQDRVLKNIYPYITGKTVLDIGCVEHTLKNKNKNRIWVHDFLRQNALHVEGIDIAQDDVQALLEQGYNVSCQNAEDFSFQRKFDVIFAGELIEHLSNPGLFLSQCYKHLETEGTLILTTPNCFSFERFGGMLLRGMTNDPPVNPQHTCWFSPAVIQELLRRECFECIQIKFVDYPVIQIPFHRRILHFFTKIFPRFSETMICISKIKK